MKKQPLVSVIMPSYNCEKFISDSIESVLNQSYENFELIIVDDISTDKTVSIIKKIKKQDKRIKLFILESKGGPAIARNKAIKEAKGKYIAFLDSDDLWKPNKLKKQIEFMEKNNIYFSYTNYEKISENGEKLNIIRKCPKKISFFRMKLGNSVGCLTVIYNSEQTGLIQIEDIKKRNDYAIWLKVLEKVKVGYLLDECLSEYRVSSNSISHNTSKVKLIKYHYELFRKNQKYSVFASCFYTFTNVLIYFWNKLVGEKIL